MLALASVPPPILTWRWQTVTPRDDSDDGEIRCWQHFRNVVDAHQNQRPEKEGQKGTEWIFRGLHKYGELKSSLERHLADFDIELAKAADVECYLVREFRRHYDGPDRELVEDDRLYCLGLLQHYGAPTRLLDWTYSPYVAMYFALEKFADAGVKSQKFATHHVGYLWCLETNRCSEAAWQAVKDTAIKRKWFKKRFDDESRRDDRSFTELYVDNPLKRFVLPENPWRFHVRHRNQQGVFLCPGDITSSFQRNIEEMKFKHRTRKRYKIIMSKDVRTDALEQLRRMNVTRASLFPGLDGFAKSLAHRLPYFKSQADMRIGKGRDAGRQRLTRP